MGGTRWSDDLYCSRTELRAKTATPTFAYNADVASGKVAAKVHDSLNPKGVTRESRDSDVNPNSRAIAVLLDVTGSMRRVPALVQEKLPQLLGLLQRKGYVSDPHILVGAIGDAVSDRAPLQVGQFEAGIEIDNDITNLYLEGNGGNGLHESYELAMYFMARHTSIDCYEKRGDKGYLFIIGDEPAYTKVSRSQIEDIIGDTGLQDDIPIQDILAELTQKYEVFFIIPNMTSHYGQKSLESFWENLLPQQVLKLEDPSGVCELIASTIATCEGFEWNDIKNTMSEVGTSLATAEAVGRSVSRVTARRGLSVPTSRVESGLE